VTRPDEPAPRRGTKRRSAPHRKPVVQTGPAKALARGEHNRLLLIERAGRELAEALGRVALAMNATLDLPELLNLICRESASLFQVQTAFVWLIEGADLFGFAAYGEGREQWLGRRVPLSDPVTLGPRVIREKRPIFVNDMAAGIRSNEVNADLVRMFHIRSILGMPLLKGERAVGALILIDTQQAGRFDDRHVQTARLFASHAATAVDNARLFEETLRRLAELEAVNRISVVLRSAPGTNTFAIIPEYKTNLTDTNWVALLVQSNRFLSGTNETFCGRPPGSNVFIRVRVGN